MRAMATTIDLDPGQEPPKDKHYFLVVQTRDGIYLYEKGGKGDALKKGPYARFSVALDDAGRLANERKISLIYTRGRTSA